MQRSEMIQRLQYSSNHVTASICSQLIEGRITVKEAKRMGLGSFMQAVLNGDYEEAMCLADLDNQRCIGEEYLLPLGG